jgi:hypothetical protein
MACFAAFGALSTIVQSPSEAVPAFLRVVAVLPPVSVMLKGREQVSSELVEASTALVMELEPERDRAAVARTLADSLEVRQAPTLLADDLLSCLGTVPDQAAVFVRDAALYHTRQHGDGQSQPDTWIRSIAAVTSKVAEWAKQNNACIVVDSGRLLPPEPLRGDLCPAGVPNATLIGGLVHVDRLQPIAKEFDRGVQHGLKAVGDLPDLEEWQRAVLASQHLSRLGHRLDAFQAYVRCATEIRDRCPPEVLIAMVRIARDAGQRDEATRIASRVRAQNLRELEPLQQAHHLGHVLGLEPLSNACADRLVELFPHTLNALSAKLTELIRSADFDGVSVLLANDADLVDRYPDLSAIRTMAETLRAPTPDYRALLALISSQAPNVLEQAAALSLRHAVDSGRPAEALALSEGCAMTDGLAAGILHAVERHILGIRDGDISQLQPVFEPLSRVVTFVAKDPSLTGLRETLSRAVSPALVGYLGPSVLVSLLRARYSLPPLTPQVDRTNAASEEELVEWLQTFYEKCRPNDTWIVGALDAYEIPSPEDARRFLPTYIAFLHHIAAREDIPEDDLHLLGQYAFIGVLIARRAGSLEDEFYVLSVVGTAFARVGYHQGCRDLAEHAFVLSDGLDATVNRRLAWHCYADLYQRVHSPVEALLGLVCMVTSHDSAAALSLPQAWAEVATVIRTLRDLHLWDDAKAVMDTVRTELERRSLFDKVRARWDFLRVSIDALSLGSEGVNAPLDQIQILAEDIGKCLQRATSEHDDLLPLVHLATQVRAMFSTVPSATAILDAALEPARPLLSGAEAKYVDAMLGDGVSMDEIVAALAPRRTRYAHDLGTDLLPLAIAARRRLTAAVRRSDPSEVIFATECLAFHGATPRISPPPSAHDSADHPERSGLAPNTEVLVTSMRDCEQIVSDCIQSLSLGALALDSTDRLVRVSVNRTGERTLTVVKSDTFSTSALKTWKRDHPSVYGIDDPNDPSGDAIAASMRDIGIGAALDPESQLLLLDAELQTLPANLLWAGDDFAGATGPVAVIPSLGWLRSSRATVRTGTRYRAWIGDADPNPMSPLSILKSELQPILDNLGIDLTDDIRQPWSDTEVAIVAAHGGLYDSSLIGTAMFRSVADETTVRLSPQELCKVIGSAKIAVLFVCSGGRVDNVPFGRELAGVPVALLRAGVQTVVASPWPLYVGVPAPWSRVFWEHLLRGATVGDACFRANGALRSQYPHPSRWLAMHVYGDPMAKLSRPTT